MWRFCRQLGGHAIRLHPKNPHYFLFRGKATALITRAVLNGAFDYRRYLATHAADWINYTRLFGGTCVEASAKSSGILHPETGNRERLEKLRHAAGKR